MSEPQPVAARRLVLEGRVQGVGFRPFVFRLARRHRLCGWVYNDAGSVHVLAEGDSGELARFTEELLSEAPPLARPRLVKSEPASSEGCREFCIRTSHTQSVPRVHLPPDCFLCDDCLAELRDPSARRYRYPFINCTQCGPRYTIIRALPYDRVNTTMAEFPLCPDCRGDYLDPGNRRFHAEPLACATCGPELRFQDSEGRCNGNEPALAAGVAALRRGAIVAVRGIGGYHLLCDATDAAAVRRLRERKHRPDKPLAVMVPLAGADGLARARQLATLNEAQGQLLRDPMRPIVLAPRANAAPLVEEIAPGLNEVGLMLPYSPLHHLLLGDFGGPLVATSANISGEPVLTEPGDVERRLGAVADAFLHHNRAIERPADDPVFRNIAGKMRPLRLGRGDAPLELALPFRLQNPMLGVGAFLKNTVALAWEDRVIVSPHLGDLSSPRSRQVFRKLVEDLQDLYGVSAKSIACDAHPDFPNSRWARQSGLECVPVHHHYAHASAAAGELGLRETVICFAWDGVGLGADGTLWGGEALVGSPGGWRRAASFRLFHPPGGERAALEPWRSALALCWEAGVPAPAELAADPLLHRAWRQGIHCPATSAVGRLFDAAAALTGVVTRSSYEAQAPMMLEALSTEPGKALELPLVQDRASVWRSDWSPLVPLLADTALAPAERAACFHASLAHALLAQAKRIRAIEDTDTVILAGGVFQNAVLSGRASALLESEGFNVRIPQELPVNDAAISYGQIIEAAARLRRTSRDSGRPV